MLCSAYATPTPERVIVIANSTDVSPVTRLLNDGWTVKFQSVALANMDAQQETQTLLVFTLTPPSDGVFAAIEAKRAVAVKEAFEKKRAEWLAKQPKVEKP